MKIITFDAETFFSDDYTLKKLSTEAYIRDPRFECHGAALKFGPDLPAKWWRGDELPALFEEIDWDNTAVLAHHAQFDGLIISHHYKRKPKFWLDTLSMARLLLGNHLSVGLDALAKHFNLQAKTVPYNLFRGKHWGELDPLTQKQVADGACHDVELTWSLFGILQKDFPKEEYAVVDAVVKMFIDPVLSADLGILRELWKQEAIKKQDGLTTLGLTEADLQSADRFAQILRDYGIEPDTKDGKKGPIYCFAKTDQFMRDLQEDDDATVRLLAETRLGVKSTILQTRAETLGGMARRGPLPVYLRYAGAGTLRPSGGDGGNFLNLKRGSPIRKALKSPEGFLLCPVDASQIECRVLHFLAGGPDEPVIQKFGRGEDPYVDIATEFYREPIYKPKKDDPRREEMEAKRGMGKQGRLMCLGPNTVVLTHQGPKAIVNVRLSDLLWDGKQWVRHQGLIYQGEQHVVKVAGVQMTFDHLILCGMHDWQPAAALADENILCQALANALTNSPLPGMSLARRAAFRLLSFVASAALQSTQYIRTICTAAKAHNASLAPVKKQAFGAKSIWATPMFAPTKRIDTGYSGEYPQFSTVAVLDQNITPTKIMGVVEFKFARLGENLVVHSWHIWSLCLVGISQNCRLIELTIKKVINRAICVLLRLEHKPRIGDDFEISNKKLPTFDISCAGPRSRFMILSERGPLIVHNCGYGAAGPKFKATAKAGLYGPPVDISLDDANRFVALYRELNPSVCARNSGYWAQAGRMLARLGGGPEVQWGPLTVKNKRIYLPEGQPLIYDTLEYYKPTPEERHTYGIYAQDGHWRVRTRQGWKELWGSKLVQNVCEAVSRVIVSQAMNRITRMGYRVLNWPYDELLVLIPKDGHEIEHAERCKAEMLKAPAWLPGLPLDAEYIISERYAK